MNAKIDWRWALLLAMLTMMISHSAAEQVAAPVVDKHSPRVAAGTIVDAGRYLVTVSGCNDCHTAGYAENDGKVAETEWLTGSAVGWRGPWGTSYPSNLRLLVKDLTEDGWATMLASRKGLPPMPWVNVNKLSDADARAIYRYITALGPRGVRMPVAVPPQTEPSTPYISLEPLTPKPVVANFDSDK